MKTLAPGAEEVELSIFGSGIGESLAIHLGFGDWVIVDSCVSRSTGRPAALEYLEEIGVAATQIQAVFATHWHDDHIAGLSQILAEASAAKFVCSAALRSEEFMKLVAAGQTAMTKTSSGVDEFLNISQLTRQRRKAGLPGFPDRWAASDQRLLLLPAHDGRTREAEVWSLSPSSNTISRSYLEFAQQLQKGPKRRFISNTNDLSVVLWVRVGPVVLLLGADLEERGRDGDGWTAIIGSKTRPSLKAHLYKVAHHGASNAHHADIWSDLLGSEPVAVLAPFAAGRLPRPTTEDLQRLCRLTPKVYCAASSQPASPQPRPSAVQKTIQEAVTNRRVIHRGVGQVRVRFAPEGDNPNATIELFNGAFKACA